MTDTAIELLLAACAESGALLAIALIEALDDPDSAAWYVATLARLRAFQDA